MVGVDSEENFCIVRIREHADLLIVAIGPVYADNPPIGVVALDTCTEFLDVIAVLYDADADCEQSPQR